MDNFMSPLRGLSSRLRRRFTEVVAGTWILATGFWSDAGTWEDTANWVD